MEPSIILVHQVEQFRGVRLVDLSADREVPRRRADQATDRKYAYATTAA